MEFMAENVIDTLSLEIESSTHGAEEAIDKLANSLKKLQNRTAGLQNIRLGGLTGQLKQFSASIRGLDVGKLSNLSVSLKNFSESIKSFSGIGKQIEPAIKNLEALSKSDFSKLRINGDFSGMKSLASGIQKFSDAAPGLAAISPKEINRVVMACQKLETINLNQMAAGLQSLNGVDTSVLINLGEAFRNFSATISGSDKIPAAVGKIFTSIAQLTSSSDNISLVTAGLSDIGNKIKEFISVMASAPAVQPGTVALVSALSGIASSGNKAQAVAVSLPEITKGVEGFMSAMSKMPVLNASTVKAVQALSQLTNAGGKAGSAAQSLQRKITGLSSSMGGLRAGTKGAVSGLGTFTKKILSMVGLVGGVYGFTRAIGASVTVASDLSEAMNVVEQGFGQLIGKIEDFSKNSIQSFGMSELAAKQAAGTFAIMGKSLGLIPDVATDMAVSLTGLTGDLASFYNISQDVARTALESIFSGETESLKRLGVVMTQANLQSFAYSQGINKSVKAMSQAELVQLRYAYVLESTSSAMGDFARTSGGSWANQVRILSEQFRQLAGIVGGVLMAAFLPVIKVINTVIGKIVQLATVISNFLVKLFGFKEAASGSGAGLSEIATATGDIADNAESAAGGISDVGGAAKKSGKELNKFVAAWHEVNSMSSNDSESSGGSGGGGVSMSDIFLPTEYDFKVEAEDKVSPVLDGIKKRFLQLSQLFLKGFKVGLGDTSVFDSITNSFKSIKDNLVEIFTDDRVIGSFNEMLDTLSYNAGIKVGSYVSIGASLADNLVGGVSIYLDEAKERVGQWLVNMFDITAQTDTIKAKFMLALANIFSVFRSDEAKELTASIIQLFSETFINVSELAAKLGRDVLNLFLAPITENADGFREALQNTLSPISEIIGTIADSFTVLWEKVQSVYDEHVKPLIDSFTSGISEIVETLLDGYSTYMAPTLDRLTEKFTEVWEESIHPLIENFIGYFGDMADLVKTVYESIFKPVISWIAENIMPVVSPVLEAFVSGFLDSFKQVADGFNGFITAARGVINFISGTFKGDWEKAWQGIQGVFKGIWDALPDYVKGPIRSIIGFVNKMIGAIESGINYIANALNGLSSDVPDWVPGIGGETFGFSINTVSLPRIPKLAKGGIVKRATTIIAGEDGAEAIVPIEKNNQWMNVLSSRIADKLSKFDGLELDYTVPQIDSYVSERSNFDMSRMQSDLQMALDARAAQEAFEMRQLQESVERNTQILQKILDKGIILDDNEFENRYKRAAVRYGRRTNAELGLYR